MVLTTSLVILATIREKPSLRIRLDYEVRRGDDLLATGQSCHAFCDLRGQPTRPPAAFVARMTEIFARP